MKKKLLKAMMFCTLLGLGGMALAEMSTPKATAAVNPNPAAVAEAHNLFESIEFSKIYSQIVDQATDELIKRQPILAKIKKDIRNFYAKYIGWDAIKNDLAKIYAKYFTVAELKDLEAFYRTPTGRKALYLLPKIEAEEQRIAIEKVIAHQEELKELVMKAIQTQQTLKKPAAK